MEKIELKIIRSDRRRTIYTSNQCNYNINGKIFDISISFKELNDYLKTIDVNLIDILNNSIVNTCINCGCCVDNNKISNKIFTTHKFCSNCLNYKTVQLYDLKDCVICGKTVLYKDIVFSTCGNKDCIDSHKLYIRNRIKDTHWCNTNKKDSLMKKRVETRMNNDILYDRHYTAWNKGKTNIYSKETIEKIRAATIKQMKDGRIKITKQERKFKDFLIENDIKHVYSFIYMKRQFDFYLPDYNLVVELQGDYWHANPMFWDVYENDPTKKKLYETQKMKIKDDIIKKQLISDSAYDFVEIWENDIHNNFDDVISMLKKNFSLQLKNN